MSNMKSWAEREVEIACKKEGDDKTWNKYMHLCYESALKAYNSLMEDGHSGMSINVTKDILNRLITDKPLTPIDEEEEDTWTELRKENIEGGYRIVYQCSRMSSLFRYMDYVNGDAKVYYHDVDAFTCQNVDEPYGARWSNGTISKIGYEMFPITMPYCPDGKSTVFYCEEFLYDHRHGDYDTLGVLYAVRPDGEKIIVNRFFKEYGFSFVEIDEAEYNHRKSLKISNWISPYKKESLKIAKQLLYGDDIMQKIRAASSDEEIERIMRTAREG